MFTSTTSDVKPFATLVTVACVKLTEQTEFVSSEVMVVVIIPQFVAGLTT